MCLFRGVILFTMGVHKSDIASAEQYVQSIRIYSGELYQKKGNQKNGYVVFDFHVWRKSKGKTPFQM